MSSEKQELLSISAIDVLACLPCCSPFHQLHCNIDAASYFTETPVADWVIHNRNSRAWSYKHADY